MVLSWLLKEKLNGTDPGFMTILSRADWWSIGSEKVKTISGVRDELEYKELHGLLSTSKFINVIVVDPGWGVVESDLQETNSSKNIIGKIDQLCFILFLWIIQDKKKRAHVMMCALKIFC